MGFMCFGKKRHKKKREREATIIQDAVENEEQTHSRTSKSIPTNISYTSTEPPRQNPEPKRTYELHTDNIINSNAGRSRLEVAKPFAPWIDSVTVIIGEIYSIYTNAQYNQRTCLVLVERVEAIEPSVKKLFRHKEENENKFREQEFLNAFIRFQKVLQQIRDFIGDVSQLKGYRKYTHAFDVKGRCQSLIKEFERCCTNLQFTIVISDEDRKKEEQYLVEDVNTMQGFLEAVGLVENQTRIKLDLVFDEIPEMQKKMKKMTNNNADGLLNAPQIPPNDLTDPSPPVVRGKVHKQMLRQVVPVACKPVIIPDNPSKDALKIKGQLAILRRLYSSNNIIKFHGVCTINGNKNIVLDWAEHGSLRKVYQEESKLLNWHSKLKIAHEICNGLVFLQACDILHHDIRCENILVTGDDSRYEAKIANFYLSRDTSQMSLGIPNLATIVRWLAPEKMPKGNNPIKEPYTFKCEIFSFGMLLWELAFERYPYENMEMPEITEHVLANKRETLNFPEGPPEIINGFMNIIVSSWNQDPKLRPVIKDLFNEFTALINIHGKHPSEVEFRAKTTSPPRSPDIIVTVVEESAENNDDLYLTSLPPSLKPIIPLEEGISAHRNSEREKAWECFEIHAQLGDPKAKYWMGYYLWEGYHKAKDPERARRLFKEAADAGDADAQLRYAFSISQENTQDFIKYLIKAADSGNATAQYNMADMYLKGRLGIEKDEKRGLQYLRLAALKSQSKAIEALKHYDVNAIYV